MLLLSFPPHMPSDALHEHFIKSVSEYDLHVHVREGIERHSRLLTDRTQMPDDHISAWIVDACIRSVVRCFALSLFAIVRASLTVLRSLA